MDTIMSLEEQLPFIIITLLSVAGALIFALRVHRQDHLHTSTKKDRNHHKDS